jgi:hypothetical protein
VQRVLRLIAFPVQESSLFSVSDSADLAACSCDDHLSSYSDLAVHCAYITFVNIPCLPQIVYLDAEGGKLFLCYSPLLVRCIDST